MTMEARGEGSRRPVVVIVDSFPVLYETFVGAEAAALARLRHAVLIEAEAEPSPGTRGDRRSLPVSYLAHDSRARRMWDLAWLVARHPARSLHDLLARRRWRVEEPVPPLRSLASSARRVSRLGRPHMHAHFAGGAALRALRLGRLLGLPFSVTAHAYDIYRDPRNLREKLERAAFATSGSAYTVSDLRRVVGRDHAGRIHQIVMGVDGERLRRREPHPSGRTVLAVGRLVEKKGFRHLLEAAAILASRRPLERLVIVGDGPLAGELRSVAGELGIEPTVEWAGARPHEEVRALLETSDLLAMPSVVASDGDRDSMPVVVKEALAMEVPVVATDEVGLPEAVRPEWGRLAPPGDSEALAEAIDELLALPAERRAAMGRAGRRWVLERCDVDSEAAKLSALIAQSALS